MADCCEDTRPKEGGAQCCGDGNCKKVLLYACSGAANVAEVADRVVRDLMAGGEGKMFCLAGLGARIEAMVQTARDADANVVIDGCTLDCGKKIFDDLGLTNFTHVRVTDLGIEKVEGARATDEEVDDIIEEVRKVLKDL
ncbi:MAG TPA: putative zinc-binding protein [Phycisphaerae bacterium]|nr:putative zinc-binding protein [Phycisphaerae bacterium]